MTEAEAIADRKAAFVRLGLRCQDLGRLWSSTLTRAFTSAIRASTQGSQSEVAEPAEVTLLPMS